LEVCRIRGLARGLYVLRPLDVPVISNITNARGKVAFPVLDTSRGHIEILLAILDLWGSSSSIPFCPMSPFVSVCFRLSPFVSVCLHFLSPFVSGDKKDRNGDKRGTGARGKIGSFMIMFVSIFCLHFQFVSRD
jgi:hypothetical protein